MENVSAVAANGTVETALTHAADPLRRRPNLALSQAREILGFLPGHPHAVQALRRMGELQAARTVPQRLAAAQPRTSAVFFDSDELASDLGELSLARFRRATELKPGWPEAWNGLAGALRDPRQEKKADHADLAARAAAAVPFPRQGGTTSPAIIPGHDRS